MNKFVVTKKTSGELAQYIADQTELFRQLNSKALAAGREEPFRYPELAARKYEIISLPDGKMQIVERKKIIDDGLTDIAGMSGIMTQTPSQRTGLDQSIRRGKYNDSMRLIGEDMTGIELKEIQSDGSGNIYNG